MSDRVLVIGATGRQGGATARELLARGRTVRALVRDPGSPAAASLEQAGAELAVGDLDDEASLRRAMRDAEGVFLALTMMQGPRITVEGAAAEERRGLTVVRLAAEANLGHLVYSSLPGTDADSGIPHFESKARIEREIHALGLPATILRPVSFMENFLTYSRPSVEDGTLVLRLPARPGTPMQLISVRDIGVFTALAFERPGGYVGRTVDIGADELTPPEIAAAFGRVSGLPARFEQTPIEQVRAFDEHLARMFEFFDEHPAGGVDLKALRAEHPGLTTFETWLRTTGWKP
ncbi:NmrA/HSCARG family protein [Microbispora sp. H10885]|uniref:NmrA/HSCARG family protein n=1 Tax=Microbispora sp. H10885 TaxID=2729110 RepID=UPI0016032321|nr:NmrA/HSCARG family protein [Microbispora sp. H10885]